MGSTKVYKQAYINGHTDAKKGKSRNYTRSMPMLKALFSPKAVNNHIMGYKHGWSDAVNKKKSLY